MLKSGQACASLVSHLAQTRSPRSHGASRERAERAQRERDTGETRARPGLSALVASACHTADARRARGPHLAATHRAGPCDIRLTFRFQQLA